MKPEPSPPKPYDARIAFLESSGTQFIDTGYRHGSLTSYAAHIQLLSAWRMQLFFFGSQSGDNSGWFAFGGGAGASYTARYRNANARFSGAWSELADVSVQFDGPTLRLIVDGVEYSRDLGVTLSTESMLPCYLFAVSSPNGADGRSTFRLISFTIKEDGAVIHDYYPVRIGDVGYMYDQVTGALLGNSGSGSFILGPDVEVF